MSRPRGSGPGVRVFSAILAIGLSVLFGWMIKRLISPAIAAEFE